jgi:hypothetical protein
MTCAALGSLLYLRFFMRTPPYPKHVLAGHDRFYGDADNEPAQQNLWMD